ncbi:thioesterase II family protein [Aneurinibacillus tyrosinisolvens]|uniref:thioesterase II family protein n=1 Tax=Aneurinibacillus tyrosinisolvens TaxID=1443435 RepID=UPI00063F5B49|nr:alpha/beta fold hydrolase [Aneurinibacillus tyrosinisolvens]
MSQLIQTLGLSSNDIQLICFPFAGGYSASFRPLHSYLQDYCDLLVVEPPGHGTNRMPLVESLESLVEIYLQALIPKLGKPFVLFGHSMGGLVVYRLAQKLEQQGVFPEALIISAIQPPDIRRKAVTHLDDGAFLDYVIRIGGVPSELVKAREVLEYFLPAFKADFKALETFEHTDYTQLQSPVHIFNGEKDGACMKEAYGWKKWVNQVRFHTFQGGHMFLLSEIEKVAETIQLILTMETAEKELIKA